MKFENRPSLLVITGRVSARIYLAQDGNIKEIKALEEKPEYFTDNEGYFETRSARLGLGQPRTTVSGAVREPYDDQRVRRFIRHLRRELWSLLPTSDIQDVYLFTPKGDEILSELQTRIRKKIRKIVKGDFMHEHPFRLLERLHAALSESVVKPAPPAEARRILRKKRLSKKRS